MRNDFDLSSNGLYVPKSQIAYVNSESLFLVAKIFHELFGHGLFCEHSSIGKNLISIIEQNGNEKKFLYGSVKPEQTFGICTKNIGNYEGFATWLEFLLCRETGNEEIGKEKKEKLPKEYAKLLEYFLDTEEKISRFGLLAQLGFPKYYEKDQFLKKMKDTLDKIMK